VVQERQTLDGTYRLDRLVGEGGMGVVYEATHARLAGRYAIKVLLREFSDRPEIRARFDREARITSLLQHPNIVQVIDWNSTTDGTSYLVMEFLSGESLASRLARVGRLPAPVVADIVEQIAAGLAAAHAHGVVHRDLKPDNIFLVPVEGRATELVKILDFGIATVDGTREAADQMICGTPQYMAPEQIEGREADVDGASDQYALAVIAYELLTGTNPFVAETLEETFARVRSGAVLPIGNPAALDPVLTRAMSKDGHLRFPSVTAFAEAFRAAAVKPRRQVVPQPSPIPVADGSQAGMARRRRRRGDGWRFAFQAAGAVAVASLLGAGAATLASASRPIVHPVSATRGTEMGTAPVANIAVNDPVAPARAAEEATAEMQIAPPAEVFPPTEQRPARQPVVRARRASRDDRPSAPVASSRPAGKSAGKPRPALAPDEDATLPPSEL